MSEWLRDSCALQFSSIVGRVRGNYSRLEVEAFGTHQVERTAAVLRSDQCFIPKCTFSYIFNRGQSYILHCIALCSACPLAVQTSPYFLFNSFASRKSDSNTSPRKHKYASAGAAFYKLCQYYTLVHCLRRKSDLKWDFPESINSSLLPRLCLT